MSAPEISLAMSTYNQAPLLRRFLRNYLKDGASMVPLLVVDDGSDDETPDVLREAAAVHPSITVHSLPHVSIAHARNHALRAASTPWLAFSDTDCILDRRYFETLSALPARFPDAVAVEGAVRPAPGPKLPFTHSMYNPHGGTYATANMAFKVKEILGLGGFDEGFMNFREDTDLALTIINRVGPIPFCSDLAVEHPHIPRTFSKALRAAYGTQVRVILSEMRLYRKHPASYSRVRHFPDARGTLTAWCRRYFALYLKECLRYLFRTPGLTMAQRMAGVVPAGQAMTVAFLEQVCIGVICASRIGEIARLKSP